MSPFEGGPIDATASSGSTSGSWQPEGERVQGDTERGRVVQSGEHRGRQKSPIASELPVSEVAGSSPAPAHPTPVPAQPDTADEALGVPIERDLWWGYLCPALANIGALKEAQSELVALGTDWAEAGRILSRVHMYYVNAAHAASKRYLAAAQPPADMAHWEAVWRAEGAEQRERELVDDGLLCDCDDYDTVHISHQRLRRYAESAVEKERERIAAAIEAEASRSSYVDHDTVTEAWLDAASLARQEPTSAEGGA